MKHLLGISTVIVLLGGTAIAGTIAGSKHDLTSFNRRAQVEAMTGLAFNNYRDPCIYCHIPADARTTPPIPGPNGKTADWNRTFSAQEDFDRYTSPTITGRNGELGAESLLCLSCHDGTAAVDMVVTKPVGWTSKDDAPLHMKLDKGKGLDRCSQCHDGITAHKMDAVVIGRSLMDDHPVGMRYPGLFGNSDFYTPNRDGKFRNGVRLFNDQIECATCHDVHNPDITPFLRVEQSALCVTCHNK